MKPVRDALALLGARASGKSTVGRLLAEELSRPFVDLDLELLRFARHAGRPARTPGELLARIDRASFRELEAAALRQVLEPCPRIVLATGGGVVEREDNRAWLRRCATCIFLSVPAETLRARLAADPSPRPPLLGPDAVAEVEAVLARRLPLYRSLADLVVECGDEPPRELARRIARELGLGASG